MTAMPSSIPWLIRPTGQSTTAAKLLSSSVVGNRASVLKSVDALVEHEDDAHRIETYVSHALLAMNDLTTMYVTALARRVQAARTLLHVQARLRHAQDDGRAHELECHRRTEESG